MLALGGGGSQFKQTWQRMKQVSVPRRSLNTTCIRVYPHCQAVITNVKINTGYKTVTDVSSIYCPDIIPNKVLKGSKRLVF